MEYRCIFLQQLTQTIHLFFIYAHVFILHLHSQPQCVPVTSSECAAVFLESYYIPVAGREKSDTFFIVTEISDQLDTFCSNALNFYACHFTHPPCDLDRGIIRV